MDFSVFFPLPQPYGLRREGLVGFIFSGMICTISEFAALWFFLALGALDAMIISDTSNMIHMENLSGRCEG